MLLLWEKSDEEILFEEKNIVYDSVSKAVENNFFFLEKKKMLYHWKKAP